MRILLEDVSFSYNENKVIDRLSYSFEQGQTYALLGRSGVGKSTLLGLLKGFQQPASGTITYEQTAKEKVEVVFQDLQLFPWQTVQQAVALPLNVGKSAKPIVQQKVRQVLKELDLTNLSAAYPSSLSGGQKQRVAMARGLVTEPDFLLLDEPTSSLDQETKEQAQGLILREQRRRQNTTIIVTHDIEEAAFLGQTVLIMEGTSLVVVDNPTFALPQRRDSVAFYTFCIQLRQALKGETL